jgi:alpha-glucosidase (family GH31 glycosyl hydrolase)
LFKRTNSCFAKAGAIIPLDAEKIANGTALPQEIILKIFAGADNTFRLYEDDGESQAYLQGEFNETEIAQTYAHQTLTVQIRPIAKVKGIIRERTWSFEINGISHPESVLAIADELPVQCTFTYEETKCKLIVHLPQLAVNQRSA